MDGLVKAVDFLFCVLMILFEFVDKFCIDMLADLSMSVTLSEKALDCLLGVCR